MLSHPSTKKIPFSSLADHLLPKIVLDYYCNSIHKNFVEICFLSCYISTYMIFSVLSADLQILLPGPLQRKSVDPWSKLVVSKVVVLKILCIKKKNIQNWFTY